MFLKNVIFRAEVNNVDWMFMDGSTIGEGM
jgi:hypothetical protein